MGDSDLAGGAIAAETDALSTGGEFGSAVHGFLANRLRQQSKQAFGSTLEFGDATAAESDAAGLGSSLLNPIQDAEDIADVSAADGDAGAGSTPSLIALDTVVPEGTAALR